MRFIWGCNVGIGVWGLTNGYLIICVIKYLVGIVTKRNLAYQIVSMIKKSEYCLYCGEKMESKTAKKKFCSDLHRVYWNREQKLNRKEIKIQDAIIPTNVIKPFEQPKTNYTINTTGEKMPDSLNWKEQLEWKRNHKK
jgi:hypothetical protein